MAIDGNNATLCNFLVTSRLDSCPDFMKSEALTLTWTGINTFSVVALLLLLWKLRIVLFPKKGDIDVKKGSKAPVSTILSIP